MRQIEAMFGQTKDLIKQMEVEVRSQDGLPNYHFILHLFFCLIMVDISVATRKILSDKVAQCKRTEISLQGDYSRAREQVQKSFLIGGGKSEAQRQRLLNTTEK